MGKMFGRLKKWFKKIHAREERRVLAANHQEPPAEPTLSSSNMRDERQAPLLEEHNESSRPGRAGESKADEQESLASAPMVQPSASPATGTKKHEQFGLIPLRADSQLDTCDFDIVAVHGLGGHWRDTWKHPNPHPQGTVWLEDFLPREFPGARIWSFGFDAGSLSRSVGDIDGAATSLVNSLHARRQYTASNSKPIVFIAHSLGGIIVKRALILANERSDYWKDIATSTLGAMFFGVPHRGADKAYWAAFAVRLVRISSLGAVGNNRFLDALKRNSTEFSRISEAFTQPAARLQKIKSFYETKRIGNDVVVDKDSARIGTNNELCIPILDADHREMCKFESMDSSQYQDVLMALHDIIGVTSGQAISIVNRQVEKYLQLDSKNQGAQNEAASGEHEWILNMEPTQQWKTSSAFSLLQVQYDENVSWQNSVAESICHDMPKEGYETPSTICVSDLQCSSTEEWKRLVPRLILSHIFSFFKESLQQMATAIRDARPDGILRVRDRGRQTTRNIPWERSFCSGTAAWEEQWMLLNCAMQCLHQRVVLVLTGLDTQHIAHLADCLNYLDPGVCLVDLDLRSRGESAIQHKMLFVGKCSDSEWKNNPASKCMWLKRFEVNTIVEANACLSSLYFPTLHTRRDLVGYSEDTAEWIWSNPTYKAWSELESGLFWIFGKAGSGKSTLAAYLQRSLAKTTQGSTLIDFFYSARGEQTESSHVHMLRAILHQILEKKTSLYPAYQRHFRKSRSRHILKWTFQDLAQCLLDLQFETRWQNHGIKETFILVVDGLDESEDDNGSGIQGTSRERALQIFPQLCRPDGNHAFKVIALSRNEGKIKDSIKAKWFLDMKEVNGGDIVKIAKAGVKSIWQNIRSPDLRDSAPDTQLAAYEKDSKVYKLDIIEEFLIKHADGVILWVVLVLHKWMDFFKDPTHSPHEILEAVKRNLGEVPKTLKEVYKDMFARLKKNPLRNEKKAGHLFTWLLLSKGTLKISQIPDVMAMFNRPNFDTPTPDHGIPEKYRPVQRPGDWGFVQALLDNLCGGFVEIIPQQRQPSDFIASEYPVDPGNSVQLIHETAREFLLDSESMLIATGSLRTSDDICLDCVCYTELIFRKPLPDGPAHEVLNSMVDLLQNSPLLGYILHAFPSLLEIQTQENSPQSKFLWQRIVNFVDSAQRDRWSSATWWLLWPWIKRLFPNGPYKMADRSGESLRENTEEVMKCALIRHVIKIGCLENRYTHKSATVLRGPTIADTADMQDLWCDASSLISTMTPATSGWEPTTSTTHNRARRSGKDFTIEKRHHCRVYWGDYRHRAGIINKSLLLHAMFVARKMKYSVALDILAAASADVSGIRDERIEFLRSKLLVDDTRSGSEPFSQSSCLWSGIRDKRIQSIRGQLLVDMRSGSESSSQSSCLWALPFQGMAELCYYSRHNGNYVEDWCNNVEIEGISAVPSDEETGSEARMEQG